MPPGVISDKEILRQQKQLERESSEKRNRRGCDRLLLEEVRQEWKLGTPPEWQR